MKFKEYLERTGQDLEVFKLFDIDLEKEVTVEDCIDYFNILNNLYKQLLAEFKERDWHIGKPVDDGMYVLCFSDGMYDFQEIIGGTFDFLNKQEQEGIIAWQKINEFEGEI